MKKLRKKAVFCILFFSLFCTAGCGKKEEEGTGQSVELYYLNREETKIVGEPYLLKETELDRQLEELLQAMAQTPEDAEKKAVISNAFSVVDAVREGQQITLTVDEKYRNLSPAAEILTRAALVRTLTQLNGTSYVAMKVRDEPLTDRSGNPVGIMEAAMFIDNAGDEINAYEKKKLKLYYTDESGTKLVAANKTVVYNTNISLEKLIVEQLIAGPGTPEIYPTVNPETKINSVTVKDGVCYVNLNENFLVQVTNVTSEVTVYSITNSLVELSNINKVQISVNGNTEVTYRETIPLSTIFERNLELLDS